ncbi:MAG: FtsX-like permease family protein, partial [Bacteroidota bacterium]
HTMFRNYCKTAIRNLLKNRTFSIINLTGLSLSVAFCLLLFFYIRHEQSYDTFHVKKDKLFRFEMTSMWPSDKPKSKSIFSFLKNKSDEVENKLVTPLIIGRDMQQNFPEIKSITRFQDQGDQLVRANKEVYKQKHILVADDNFFSNFSFPSIKGNAKTALAAVNNAVISESTAKKYFGTTDAVGRTIEMIRDSNRVYIVSAVTADAPLNSSIQYDIVLPLLSDPDYAENIKGGFNQSSHLLVVELADGVQLQSLENKLNQWSKKYFIDPFVADYGKYYKDVDFTKFRFNLRPFADSHYNVSAPWGHYTDAKNIYQLSCLAIIILLIASLNYILLTISNAAARTQEVGVRKVMGANRRSIILQFWIETQMLVLFSVLTGLLIARLFIPLFNSAVDTQLSFGDIPLKEIAIASTILSLALGVLAGYYPALLISKMKVVSVIKSFQTFKINPRFSKILVVLQYTACVVFMISAFVIQKQMKFINNKDLGFDKEQVLMVTNPTWDPTFTKPVHDRLRDFAATQPYISYFSGMNGGLNGAYNTNGFLLDGVQRWRKALTVDYNYFEMLGLKFVQGRPFSKDIASDSLKKIRSSVVNETLFNMLGKKAKLGEFCEPLNSKIIGVVKDYNIETLTKKIEPTEHLLARDYEMFFMFKIKAGQMQQAISKIEKEWKDISGNYPFEYTFLDQTIAKMYEADKRWQKTMAASCFFAIFIACMGLFGLSAINAVNRTKEIGIRKVLGASVKDIVASLSTSFVFMIAIAILLATPIAWWIMNKWLEDFAYRIQISWWMFAVTGLIALFIALAAVSYHAIKAAMANPVKALRA